MAVAWPEFCFALGSIDIKLSIHWLRKMKNVTVIVPIYNAARTLNRCIQAITDQTYGDLEILLIDDGSEDESLDICKAWEKRDMRITVIHKENEGLGWTRNLGIAISTCEYIVFADADDWMELRFIEFLMKKMKSSGADICLCDIVYWNSETNTKTISNIRFNRDVVVPQDDVSIMNKVRTFAWGKLWRKDLFSDGFLFPKWTFEDLPVVPLLAYKASKIAYVHRPLYNYWRNQSDSLSMQGSHILDIQKSLHLLKNRGEAMKMTGLAQLEIKKIMLGQARFAYKRWHDNLEYRDDLNKMTDSLAVYYDCFKDYGNTTFRKSRNEKINDGIRCVVFSENQILEQGKIDIDVPSRVQNGGKWEIAEYIMERL